MNSYDEIFLSVLGSKERLIAYIDNDIDLVAYVNLNHKNIITAFKTITSITGHDEKIKKYFNKVNPTYVLNLLKEKREDLFDAIIAHPQGLIWIRKQRFEKILEL